jgi:hypothetical protein
MDKHTAKKSDSFSGKSQFTLAKNRKLCYNIMWEFSPHSNGKETLL